MLALLGSMLVLHTPTIVRLYSLDGGEGRLAHNSILSDTFDADGGAIRLPSPSFLIRHGKDWMVWDTGLPDTLVGHPKVGALALSKTRTESSQLKALGLTPKDVRCVALSHCHFDHAGTLGLFRDADWIVERSELAYMRLCPSSVSVDPSLLVRKGRGRTIAISGDDDVFGDGTVRILWTPGHTPGHCCLLLRLQKAGYVLLSGDLTHSRHALQRSWIPSINASRSESLASLDRVKAIVANLHARLVIQHDPADWAALPKAPKFMD